MLRPRMSGGELRSSDIARYTVSHVINAPVFQVHLITTYDSPHPSAQPINLHQPIPSGVILSVTLIPSLRNLVVFKDAESGRLTTPLIRYPNTNASSRLN